nr:MAG TPA: hypothetical protein [Caudoviricetes sp.]
MLFQHPRGCDFTALSSGYSSPVKIQGHRRYSLKFQARSELIQSILYLNHGRLSGLLSQLTALLSLIVKCECFTAQRVLI